MEKLPRRPRTVPSPPRLTDLTQDLHQLLRRHAAELRLGGTVARLLASTPNEVEQAAEATVGLPLTSDELSLKD